jgi:hypothetical protein
MFKVFLHRTDFMDKVDMYIIDRREDGRESYLTMGGDGSFPMVHTVEMGSEIKPFLSLSGVMAKEFFQTLAEALDKEGVKTDNDAKIAGTLEATRYHLEDLREMLKLGAPKGEPSNA